MRAASVMGLLFALALSACDKKETPTPTTTETTPATPATTAAPVATTAPATAETTSDDVPEVEIDGVPTEEDYEEKAAEQVTASNMEDELDKLEKEIAAN